MHEREHSVYGEIKRHTSFRKTLRFKNLICQFSTCFESQFFRKNKRIVAIEQESSNLSVSISISILTSPTNTLEAPLEVTPRRDDAAGHFIWFGL